VEVGIERHALPGQRPPHARGAHKGKGNRLIQGLIQLRSREYAGLLIPLGDIELFVQSDQG